MFNFPGGYLFGMNTGHLFQGRGIQRVFMFCLRNPNLSNVSRRKDLRMMMYQYNVVPPSYIEAALLPIQLELESP
jgi:hypothetical protein